MASPCEQLLLVYDKDNMTEKLIHALDFAILTIIYRCELDYIFRYVIIYYQNEGYSNQQSTHWVIISWIILLAFIFMYFYCYENDGTISQEVLFILYIISIVPFTTMISYGQFPAFYVFLNTSYWTIIMGLKKYIFKSKRKYGIRFVLGDINLKDEKILYFLAWTSFAIVLYLSGRYMGFRFHFGLSDVYSIRRDIDNLNLPTILYYLFSWTKAINPICLAYFIINKKWVYTILTILVQLLSFGIDGMKATLFTTIVVVAICLVPELSVKKLNKLCFLGINIVCITGIIIFQVKGSFRLLALIIRRVVFTPNRISWCYFDYFKDKAPDFFRGSILQHFGAKSPYSDITVTIGKIYYGSAEYVSNNGLISDGIVNFGNIGAYFMPFFIVLVLYIFDKCSSGLDKRLYVSCSIRIAITLMSMFLSTAILTNGFILIMVLLYVMRRNSMNPKYK